MILQRISRKQVTQFYKDYYHGECVGMRMGEAFLKRFYPGVTDSILFLEDSDKEAADHLEEHYVVLEQVA